VLILWPKYFKANEKDEEHDVSLVEELIQLALALVVCMGIAWSFLSKKNRYEPIKWLLFI